MMINYRWQYTKTHTFSEIDFIITRIRMAINNFCMNIFTPFLLLSLIGCAGQQTQQPTEQVNQPNILIIMADDMGYGDLSGYGGMAQTPNIDALADEGIKLTNCYAGAPNCSPSRVSLLTGRIPARVGMYSYRPPGHLMHMPDTEITLAELLKTKAYQTAHFGKWHLGCLPQDSSLNQPQPDQQGFDYSLGTANNAVPSHLNPTNFVRNGLEVGEMKGYACQIVADEVEDWFEQYYEEKVPFFMYVAFHEPHAKIASPPELIANYPNQKPKDAAYFANIENMDLATGRILETLKNRGLDKNTLVFFTSDNGSYRMGSNGPLRGLKGEVYEGGMKVPGIFSYPNGFEGKRVVDSPIWFQDVLPTICKLVGIELPKDRHYDGISLLPLLQDKAELKRAQPMLWFFYRSAPELAMRKGDYVLVAGVNDHIPRTHWLADIDMPFIKNLRPDFFELYNVVQDVGQQEDLSDKEPEKLMEMKQAFQQLFEGVQDEGPIWKGLPAYDLKRANHHKPAEFKRNQQRFLEKQ